MSKRFQHLNKYRNAVGKVANKEAWYADLTLGSSPSDHCNLIQASRNWIAVKWTGNGGSMGLLPIDQPGKGCSSKAHVFHAHGAAVSDWSFSDFDDNLLATGAEDGLVKVWKISQEDETPVCLTSLTTPSRRVDLVRFHPTADQIVTTLGNDGKKVCIWDIEKSSCAFEVGTTTTDPFHSFSWKGDGSLFGTSSKGAVDVWDPRAQDKAVMSGSGHEGIKGSRVVWLGDSNAIFTVGMNKLRNRQYALWDVRSMSSPLKMTMFDSSTGIVIPLYDEDTETMYMMSRGDTTIRSLQLSDVQTTPTIAENMACGTNTSIYGAALLPKQSLNVMHAEVARVLAVTENAVLPISFEIPRKQYLDFHAELFPDTKGNVPGLSGSQWISGKNAQVAKVSLDPSNQAVNKTAESIKPSSPRETTPQQVLRNIDEPSVSKPSSQSPTKQNSSNTVDKIDKSVNNNNNNKKNSTDSTSDVAIPKASTSQQEEPVKPKAVPKYGSNHASAYKYISGKAYHPSTHFEDLRGLSVDKSGEVDLIKTNGKLIAVPIAGPGGRVGIISVNKPGRLPTHVPCVLCGSEVTNFQFNPFNDHVLATVSEDNKIRVWTIPEGGLEEDLGEPTAVIGTNAMDKIALLEYHPNAENILMTVSSDISKPTIRIWDLVEQKEKIVLTGMHPDIIFAAAWSPDGSRIATVARDKKIRVLDARTGKVLAEGPAHDNARPSRLVWLGASRIASVGFGRGSMREVLLFNTDDLTRPVKKNNIDVSPSVMGVHYDPDCRVLYVAGKGDRTIHTFELEDDDTLKALAKIESGTLQQGFAFFPKSSCNVRETEIGKFYRLTPNSIELVGVRIPRARPEFFQDDIFVETLDFGHPAQDSASWFSGENKGLKRISLKPDDMTPLSLAPPPPQQAKAKEKFEMGKKAVTEDQRRQELMDRMFSSAKEVVATEEKPVDPNDQEVADDEWDD
ncbi:hypothetical protein J3Q64DRAFT_1835582 [Phycomyces blakesleeanus]|uniref:Coronin n=2 Tax=Phycomyces blakesleeanus TaxID=4837 RepID=A0A167P2G6_PHYB8|nr:hypothetical protein PHYBLDRAFT_180336 [Phycomyces blakesleeanus NRRL 1555(-)]OAD77121.1 hypothetical protein PHYBLDRAFT_180336 [Phycomyces blakesleeanus NRRL 1555(-)]|eukprot:XP_018295161.1 hypothetical protein PHYBLDRAFT_180336 [Phycomyces blakesleeanus NRRL 1555(-)]